MRVHICSFASAIGDMKRRDQKSLRKVLAVIKQSPRFSTFDASENMAIAKTVTELKVRGFIEYPEPQPGYPWCKAKVTESGEAYLNEVTESQS